MLSRTEAVGRARTRARCAANLPFHRRRGAAGSFSGVDAISDFGNLTAMELNEVDDHLRESLWTWGYGSMAPGSMTRALGTTSANGSPRWAHLEKAWSSGLTLGQLTQAASEAKWFEGVDELPAAVVGGLLVYLMRTVGSVVTADDILPPILSSLVRRQSLVNLIDTSPLPELTPSFAVVNNHLAASALSGCIRDARKGLGDNASLAEFLGLANFSNQDISRAESDGALLRWAGQLRAWDASRFED